jgi:rod shape-determining protein MreC
MRRPSTLTFIIILLLVCGALVAWHYRARGQGAIAAPESAVMLALRPLQRGLMGVGGWASDVARVAVRRGDLADENRTLARKVAFLESERLRLVRYRTDNEELRRLLKMPELAGGHSVTADIVAFAGTNVAQRITLNAGSRSGVRPKDVVYNERGLVGQIEAVANFSSTAVLLTDPQLSGVGAMTARTRAPGVVVGDGENGCEMEYLPFNADVRPGDLVVTSGKSEIFPRGLVIGRVAQIERDKTYSRLSARVEPVVAFDRITAVHIRVGAGG